MASLQSPGIQMRGGPQDQAFLASIAQAVMTDLQARNLPRLSVQLMYKYAYTDLPCPSIATTNPEIHAVFIDHNDSTDTVFMVFRKAGDQTLSYEGFFPFGADEQNVALISLYVGLYLTLEYDRQYRNPWSMQAILKAYPEIEVDPTVLGNSLQRFGLEVLGYDPQVFQPPYNIVLAT